MSCLLAGDIWVVHVELPNPQMPSCLDLDVSDDRLTAPALLQSAHAGSMFVIATGDLKVQTKLRGSRSGPDEATRGS